MLGDAVYQVLDTAMNFLIKTWNITTVYSTINVQVLAVSFDFLIFLLLYMYADHLTLN